MLFYFYFQKIKKSLTERTIYNIIHNLHRTQFTLLLLHTHHGTRIANSCTGYFYQAPLAAGINLARTYLFY